MYLYKRWLAIKRRLIDININTILILVVIKFVSLFDHAAACNGPGGGVLGEHYIYIAFTSKIGA